jgi:hypothetical protein
MGSNSRSTLPVDSPLAGSDDPMGDAAVDTETLDELDELDAPGPTSARKSRGMAIAIALLVILVALAGWYAMRLMKN